MKKIDKMKKILRILILIFIFFIVFYSFIFVLPKRKNTTAKEEDKIMDYKLYDRDTELYKEIFLKLKEELSKEEIDYNKYAEYISELFIVDLYTLENKNDKNDVGGKMYVYDSIKDNFILNASDTLYKYIGLLNELPKVNSIELVDLFNEKYNIKDKEYDSYVVNLRWTYEKDLGYDKEGSVIVILENKKLYIVEKNNGRID